MAAYDVTPPIEGGIAWNPASKYAQEMRKWNTPKRDGGYGPNGYEEFPRMLYQARDEGRGKYEVHRQPPVRYAFPMGAEGDALWQAATLQAEEFTKRCQLIVHNETEKVNMLSRGWYLTQDEALQAADKAEEALAIAAAERAFADAKMGEKARAEAAAEDRAHFEHLGEIARTPKPKGRKPKAPMVVVP